MYNKFKSLVKPIELQMALAVGICALLSLLVWDKIQILTSCITVLLCTQPSSKDAFKSVSIRLLVTVIGAAAGVFVSWLSSLLENTWLLTLMTILGVLAVLVVCRLFKVPAISARIGALTFIVVCFNPGAVNALSYSLYRALSTVIGGLVVLLITWAGELISRRFQRSKNV